VVESRAAALTWFAQEYPGLLRAVELATARGLDEHAWRLPWALVTYFDLQGRWRPFKATQNLALAAAQRLGNVEAEGRDGRRSVTRSECCMQETACLIPAFKGHVVRQYPLLLTALLFPPIPRQHPSAVGEFPEPPHQ